METTTVKPIVREGWSGTFVAASCPFCGGGVNAQERKDGKGIKKPIEECRHLVSITKTEVVFQKLPTQAFWTDPCGAPHTVTILESNRRMTRIEYLDNTRRHGGSNGRAYATRRQVWVYNTEIASGGSR